MYPPSLLAPTTDGKLPETFFHLNAGRMPALVVAEAVILLLHNLPIVIVISQGGGVTKLKFTDTDTAGGGGFIFTSSAGS